MYKKLSHFISPLLSIPVHDITSITLLKSGFTNASYLITLTNGDRYILRYPRLETEALVNRRAEAATYEAIKDLGISDQVLYIDPTRGLKLSSFIEEAHCLDLSNQKDLCASLLCLHHLHRCGRTIDYRIDFPGLIAHYERLRRGASQLADYEINRKRVIDLLAWLEGQPREEVLCHGDFNCQNILLGPDEQVHLIDFEYAGMGDPAWDVASLCLHSQLDLEGVHRIIEAYYGPDPDAVIYDKVYAYLAIGGFIWSLWTELREGDQLSACSYLEKQYQYVETYYTMVLCTCSCQ